MPNRVVIAAVVEIVACVYGVQSDLMRQDPLFFLSLTIYLADAVLAIIEAKLETQNDLRIRIGEIVFLVRQIVCLHLVLASIAIFIGISRKIALLNLIPPFVDIVMGIFVDQQWQLLTPLTSVMCLLVMFYLAVLEANVVLMKAYIAFLLSTLTDQPLMTVQSRKAFIYFANALGLYCVIRNCKKPVVRSGQAPSNQYDQ